MTVHENYMRRAMQLALCGEGFTSPNPMVGAVVVADGRIIGEGFHRRFGGPHAEVNAIASVREADRHLLRDSTIYVTLEPCSHYGKTPPCAKLIIDSRIPRVVTGAPDPNPKVSGRGIRMLREAGCDVTEGVLAEECVALNRRFITAQTLRRPYIQLKWAQSRNGFMSAFDSDIKPVAFRFSNRLTSLWTHRERSLADAIMAGPNTIAIDNPRLDVRLYPGRNPVKVSFADSRISPESNFMNGDHILLNPELPLAENMGILFSEHGISSLMVEGGPTLLQSFIDEALYDEIRIETSPLSPGSGLRSPHIDLSLLTLAEQTFCRGNRIERYYSSHLPSPMTPAAK